ncbi:MAG: PASTA domain-containing protein [Chitinophagaceae bacterium]|nr:PASTA domain-containing protein [Chitinophagaceae bacterium]
MFKFITNRPLWVNLFSGFSISYFISVSFLQTLSWMTKHGQYLTVPSVLNKKTNEAIKLLESKGFDVRIQDSVYTDTAANGIVLKQLPDANSTVKVNRTVFLTVNRVVPPLIDMPKLEGLSLGFALDMLQRNHLKLQDTIYKPDFMRGSIIEQQYNGVKIPEKAKLPWGSKITLIVGAGLEQRQMIVPDLIGMTYAEAKQYLADNGLTLAATISDGPLVDSANAYVYEQNPKRFTEDNLPNYISSGQVMDLFIAAERRVAKDSVDTKKAKRKKKINMTFVTPKN